MEQPIAQQNVVPQQVVEQPTSVDTMRLKNFPISYFASILGLSGFTIAFQKAETILKLPIGVSSYLLFFTIALFLSIAIIYIIKAIRFPGAVKGEFAHPIKINFFPTLSISLLLFSIAFLPIQHEVSRYLWITGTLAHAVFTLAIISVWINSTVFQIQHFNPAWFIPVVGNIIIPLAGVEHFNPELSWLFFSVGMIFWVVLFTIFIYRIIFHTPMAQKLLPTLFIMIAPPAVGYIAYVKLMEQDVAGFTGDAFSRVLYYFALFLFIMLVSQFRLFFRIKQFYLSWWAYSFPIAAMTISSTLMYSKTQAFFYEGLALGLLGMLTIIIVTLLFKTWNGIMARQICVED